MADTRAALESYQANHLSDFDPVVEAVLITAYANALRDQEKLLKQKSVSNGLKLVIGIMLFFP